MPRPLEVGIDRDRTEMRVWLGRVVFGPSRHPAAEPGCGSPGHPATANERIHDA
jgi:hypothetical protein